MACLFSGCGTPQDDARRDSNAEQEAEEKFIIFADQLWPALIPREGIRMVYNAVRKRATQSRSVVPLFKEGGEIHPSWIIHC